MASAIGEAISSIQAELGKGQTTLVAVSKYRPAAEIQAAYDSPAAQRHFGENYLQELARKSKELPKDIRWHYIGAMHSNQCKALAEIENLKYIHSVTTVKQAKSLASHRSKAGFPNLKVMLQVNTSGSSSKSGLAPLDPGNAEDSELVKLARHVVKECTDGLELVGLMTIGSAEQSMQSEESGKNSDFTSLKDCRDKLEELLKLSKGTLQTSMGMSADYLLAAREGSNFIRVGSKIFGERPAKPT